MKCPFCGFENDKVVDSRESKEADSIRRRRECLKCEKRFTTYERIDEIPYMVVKKDGRRERFDRQKVLNGLMRACEKRPVPITKLEQIVNEAEAFVIPTGYSFNLDGSTLYLSLASVFVAQAAGIELTLGQQLLMMLTLMLTSKGVAGVPRAALAFAGKDHLDLGVRTEPERFSLAVWVRPAKAKEQVIFSKVSDDPQAREKWLELRTDPFGRVVLKVPNESAFDNSVSSAQKLPPNRWTHVTATFDGAQFRIPYSGTTCLGPISGTEILRKS